MNNNETAQHAPKANAAANATENSSSLLKPLKHLCRRIIDSGATDHITSSSYLLIDGVKNTYLSPILLPSGEQARIVSIGNVPLSSTFLLQDVLCVPTFKVV